MNALEQHFELLNEAVIREQHFDILANKWTMKLEWVDGDYSKWYNLEIQDISCFYFANNATNRRKNIWEPEEGDFLELTSIGLLEKLVDIHFSSPTDEKHWLTQFEGGGNIYMEIWSNILVIEAKYIQIDNERYELY